MGIENHNNFALFDLILLESSVVYDSTISIRGYLLFKRYFVRNSIKNPEKIFELTTLLFNDFLAQVAILTNIKIFLQYISKYPPLPFEMILKNGLTELNFRHVACTFSLVT